jgi:predicted phage-related endonuclease
MQAAYAMAVLDRSQGLGGTDAQHLLARDWGELYDLKTGAAQPPDLSNVFKVQLGLYTEPLHADWFTRLTGLTTVEPQPFYVHPEIPWMYCHLDRWVPAQGLSLELKHTYGGATLRDVARYYAGQLTHQMLVLGKNRAWLSMIAGNAEPEQALVELDSGFAARLLDLEHRFWWHVEHRIRPDITPVGEQEQVLALVPTIRVNGLRSYDMAAGGNNLWAECAGTFLATLDAHRRHEAAEKELKALTPDDAEQATGHGVTVKRDKRGRLTVRAV